VTGDRDARDERRDSPAEPVAGVGGARGERSAEALDRIARVACRVLDVPVALVNLIAADRQQFVGCGGPEPWASMTGMPLDAGFCPFVLGGDAYTLEDAWTVPAHAGDPAVELGVVAYAGVPLRRSTASRSGPCARSTSSRGRGARTTWRSWPISRRG
jgi:hypothetical protein